MDFKELKWKSKKFQQKLVDVDLFTIQDSPRPHFH